MTIASEILALVQTGASMGEIQAATKLPPARIWSIVVATGWETRWMAAKSVRTMGKQTEGIWFVGRSWSVADITKFIALYPTADDMYEVAEPFGISTAQATSFAKRLRDGGWTVPKRERRVTERTRPDRVDYRVTEDGRTYTIGGDRACTVAWAAVLRRDGCKVERL